MSIRRFGLFGVLSICLVFPAVYAETPAPTEAPATQPATETAKFLRFTDDGHGGGKLETAIATYRNAAGQTVRLVAAVHIGEKSYYESLNDTFSSDDAVLYEMVKPKNAGPPQPYAAPKSGISQFQHFLKDSLALDFQLDDVDYSRPNFVHADLSAEEFEKMQSERGENMFTLILQQMMQAMSKESANVDADQTADELIKMLCRPDSERQVKLMLARHMGDVEDMAAGLDGPKGSVILTERNRAALKVLKRELTDGKQHISIFYGAAHMPSMSKSLTEDLGFKPVGVEYRMAWDMTIRPDEPSLLEQVFRGGLKALTDDGDQ